MSQSSRNFRVIALELHKRGFGFAVFETPTHLLDWGARRAAPSTKSVLDALKPLIKQWSPTAIAFTCIRNAEPRGKKLLRLLRRICAHRIPMRLISPPSGRLARGKTLSRHHAAINISQKYPFLALAVPARRKLWQSEAYRMQAFGAIGAGLEVISERSSYRL